MAKDASFGSPFGEIDGVVSTVWAIHKIHGGGCLLHSSFRRGLKAATVEAVWIDSGNPRRRMPVTGARFDVA